MGNADTIHKIVFSVSLLAQLVIERRSKCMGVVLRFYSIQVIMVSKTFITSIIISNN